MARMDRDDARDILHRLRLDVSNPPDFHALPSSKVEEVLAVAAERKYRKPQNAPGSKARMFYQYVTRAAGCWA